MAGQSVWNDAGSTTNAYIVRPEISKSIYYEATYGTLFGKLNMLKGVGPRTVSTVVMEFEDGTKKKIDVGNDSPIWEKDYTENNECRYTMRERPVGLGTHGEADVIDGDFARYKHSVCYVTQNDTPAMPIPGSESQEKVKSVLGDLVAAEKKNLAWLAQENMDLDGWRSIFLGASRGVLNTKFGGMGKALPGGSAGEQRSSYNNIIAGSDSLVTPNYTLATHETALYNALSGLNDDDKFGFYYDSHRRYSYWVNRLKLKPVRIGGKQYRAVALIDERNIYRMTSAGGSYDNLFRDAGARGMDNPAVNHTRPIELDNILYIPCQQMEFFRPTLNSGAITYGCGLNVDPRASSFSNSSNICPVVYMGAGALLRGRRQKVWFTMKEGDFSKGSKYAMHWHDGWMRNDWRTEDGRTEISNDSMFIAWHFDKGVGVSYGG